MIELKDVNKFYGNNHAIKNVSFQVEEGETLVLLGRSGCGKTTTLKMINRLIPFDSGDILINGISVMDWNPIRLRRNVGYVFQNIGLFPHLNIYDNLTIVPKLLRWSAEETAKWLDNVLNLLQIDRDLLKRRPRQLSGGQRQRIGVGRALIGNPNIVLMDEPFGALDPITREEIQEEFSSVKHLIQKTIVFVTHDIHEAFTIGDKICLFEGGEIAQIGTPYQIVHEPANEFVERFIARHMSILKEEIKK
ncbi:ABC transporter ATP-binding protein [Candidatus Haliotispira prima]|uniref:ABC transporter ATP-binding protein n=1 Tax=Candidatus Haliotispira prima TaxID=3034016 RepID=A0ABY8MJ99_9SPIO|nr:ABC transporter ATP-binding protein [Candidatus Haliotispira prima]